MKADQCQEAFATTLCKSLGRSRSDLQTVRESEFEGNHILSLLH